MTFKKILIILLIALLGTLGFFYFKPDDSRDNNVAIKNPQNESPKIVSTNPEPLDNSVIPAQGVVEITFNRPLENIGEFKVKIEPEIKFKTELSGDRKTAKIIPEEPYQLGTTYTLFIGPETKFDGVGRWGEEKIFHFKTIPYKGV